MTVTDINFSYAFHSQLQYYGPTKDNWEIARREIRDCFYSNRKKLARKQIKDIPGLPSDGQGGVYISESLTSSRKKLFGEINTIKQSKKWGYISTQNGKLLLREAENTRIYGFDTMEDLADFTRP